MHTSLKLQDWLIYAFSAAFTYFICSIAFYIDIGQDMGASYFIPIMLPVLFTLIVLQYGAKQFLFTRGTAAALFAGALWVITFPLLYTWTFQKGWYMSLICYDFLVGTAIFCFLASGFLTVVTFSRAVFFRKCCAVGFTVLTFGTIVIPIMQIAYYIMVWHCLSPASLMALYLTNYRESIDFLQTNISPIVGLLIVLCSILLAVFFYQSYRALANLFEQSNSTSSKYPLALCSVFLVSIATLYIYLPQTSIAGLWKDVDDYVTQMRDYGTGHDERFADLSIDPTETLPAKRPGTVIVVIGESASRNYMKTYTSNFPYENTPWMDIQQKNDGFILFQNVYSSWTQTVPTLQRALTEQSQYNGKDFFTSTSVIDVAKKAGYETYWFSNQGRYGQFDSIITLIAQTADHAEWTDDSYNFTDKYDEELLHFLKAVNPNTNNFIVLHIMGSHIYYNNRYPASFNHWQGEYSSMSSLESYANSILYTDHILNEIYDYARENMGLQAMIYFSDHGENLEISHNPDVFRFDMVRIPMFIYLSEDYRTTFPEQSRTLIAHRESYFTNDMIYDTLCGLLNAPSNRYDVEQDLSSPAYRFHQEDLTTMLGTHRLTEDPYAPHPEN